MTEKPDVPKVLNKYKLTHEITGVYCGRGSPYGNPYMIPKDGNRDEVCDKFEKYIYDPEQENLVKLIKKDLKDRNLICFCAPLRCHCDTLLKIANE